MGHKNNPISRLSMLPTPSQTSWRTFEVSFVCFKCGAEGSKWHVIFARLEGKGGYFLKISIDITPWNFRHQPLRYNNRSKNSCSVKMAWLSSFDREWSRAKNWVVDARCKSITRRQPEFPRSYRIHRRPHDLLTTQTVIKKIGPIHKQWLVHWKGDTTLKSKL